MSHEGEKVDLSSRDFMIWILESSMNKGDVCTAGIYMSEAVLL